MPCLSGFKRAFSPISFSVFSATPADLPPMIHPSPNSECSPLNFQKPHSSLAAISSSRTLPIIIESFRQGRKIFLKFTSSPGKSFASERMSTSKEHRFLMLPGHVFVRKALQRFHIQLSELSATSARSRSPGGHNLPLSSL